MSSIYYRNLIIRTKKKFSIEHTRTQKEGNWIRVHNWSTLFCKQLGLPTKAAIYHHCTSDGIGSHLTIKYEDSEKPGLTYEYHYWYGRDTYTCKLFKGTTLIKKETLHAKESPILSVMAPGYAPEPFDRYITTKQLPFQFGSMSVPLIEHPEPGDTFKTPPGKDDIVINASSYPNTRIAVCGFIASKNEYQDRDDAKWKIKVIRKASLPEHGVVVILSTNESL